MDKEYLKQFLIQVSNSLGPWISRKEIASWSAIILYLSVFLVFLNNVKILIKHKIISIIFLTFFTFLITIFIHQQFGSMVDALATQRVFNKYIYTIVETDSLPNNFDYKIIGNNFIPKGFSEEIKNQNKLIRCHNFFERITLPYVFKFIKEKSTVETEEGVIYNLILISFIVMVIIIYKQKSTIDQIEVLSRKSIKRYRQR